MINHSWLFKATVVALHISTVAFSQWERQESGVSVTLQDVCFVDSLHGWAVGDSATIIATINGGKTWERQRSPVSGVTLEKVFFVNQNVGYAIGWDGTILATKDGGRTWTQNESGVDYLLLDISFINADTGWVAGSDLQTRKRGVILHTKDGGQTWQIQFDTYSPSIFSSQLFSAVTFLNKQDGWAFAGDFVDNFSPTNVYRTSDGGENWTIIGQVSGPLFEMSIVSQDTIWASGFGFYNSTDGGVNWSGIGWPSDYVGFVHDVGQIDGQTGWLVATFITGSRIVGSRILLTKDGGTTFSEVFVDSTELALRAMARYKRHLWVVGYAGVILYYNDRPSRVDMPRIEVPQTFRLAQNFPNPFHSGTTIGFSLNKKQYVTITVYDLAGKEIAVLLSQTLPPGTHLVTWDGKDKSKRIRLASGVYFYELRSADLALRKKMLLMN